MTVTGAKGVRDSSKRTTGRAGLNEGGECVSRLEMALLRRSQSLCARSMTLERPDRDRRQRGCNEDIRDPAEDRRFLSPVRSAARTSYRNPLEREIQQGENASFDATKLVTVNSVRGLAYF